MKRFTCVFIATLSILSGHGANAESFTDNLGVAINAKVKLDVSKAMAAVCESNATICQELNDVKVKEMFAVGLDESGRAIMPLTVKATDGRKNVIITILPDTTGNLRQVSEIDVRADIEASSNTLPSNMGSSACTIVSEEKYCNQ